LGQILPRVSARHGTEKGSAVGPFFGPPTTAKPRPAVTDPYHSAMSKLVWKYEGKVKERHGEQCCAINDTVVDDVLGEVKAVRLDGGHLLVEMPPNSSWPS
jgi:hypothetical protein